MRDLRDNAFIRFAKPGHFYSPIPDIGEVDTSYNAVISRGNASCSDIDLNVSIQCQFAEYFSAYLPEMPFFDEPYSIVRYFKNNTFLSISDAFLLYAILRQSRPTRVIEIGSGFSSAVILDTSELFLGGALQCTFIEPYPERLMKLLRQEDKVSSNIEIIPEKLQDVSLDVFKKLQQGDLLFIDSSHVVKFNSDVLYIFTLLSGKF